MIRNLYKRQALSNVLLSVGKYLQPLQLLGSVMVHDTRKNSEKNTSTILRKSVTASKIPRSKCEL